MTQQDALSENLGNMRHALRINASMLRQSRGRKGLHAAVLRVHVSLRQTLAEMKSHQ